MFPVRRRPSSRYPNRRIARRVYRRRLTSSSIAREPVRSFYGWPATMKFTHRLAHEVSFNPATGGTSSITLNVNSTYLPYDVGHQPYGRDQVALIYQFYRVMSCDIKVTLLQTASSGSGVCICPQRDATVSAAIQTVLEQPGCVSKFSTYDTPAVVTCHIDFASIAGVSRAVYLADDQYGAFRDTSPAEGMYAIIYVIPPNSTVDLAAQNVIVELTQYTIWRSPATLTGS